MTTNISAFRGGVLPDVIGCPPFIVDQAVKDAIIQVSKDAVLYQQAFEHSVDASADVDTVDNDSITIDLDGYISDTLRPTTVQKLKIDGQDWGTLYFELNNDVSDITLYQITDTKFFNFPSITDIKIFPMDTTNDVEVFLDLALVPLRTMTTIDDFIYNDHRIAVEEYAKHSLMIQKGKTWSDPILAEYHLSKYSRKMEDGKIDRMHGFTKGSLRPKSQRFF